MKINDLKRLEVGMEFRCEGDRYEVLYTIYKIKNDIVHVYWVNNNQKYKVDYPIETILKSGWDVDFQGLRKKKLDEIKSR